MSTYFQSFSASQAYYDLMDEAVSLKREEKSEPMAELRKKFQEAYHEHVPYYGPCALNWEGYPDEPAAWFLFLDDVGEHAARVEYVLKQATDPEPKEDNLTQVEVEMFFTGLIDMNDIAGPDWKEPKS
tara:strand:- start:44 stop:427 length:384 start_codon:yes stop_codon:yes gene_type:complete